MRGDFLAQVMPSNFHKLLRSTNLKNVFKDADNHYIICFILRTIIESFFFNDRIAFVSSYTLYSIITFSYISDEGTIKKLIWLESLKLQMNPQNHNHDGWMLLSFIYHLHIKMTHQRIFWDASSASDYVTKKKFQHSASFSLKFLVYLRSANLLQYTHLLLHFPRN